MTDIQQREDMLFGAAWRRCEVALPEGWHTRFQSGVFGGDGQCVAEAWNAWATDAEQAFGETPTAALNALA